MTIYGYVRSKQELFGAVCDLAFSEIRTPLTVGRPWDDEIIAVMGELHEICSRHPNLVAILLSDPALGPTQFARRGRILDALGGAGFPPSTADRALAAMLSITIGFSAPGSAALRERPDESRKRTAPGTDQDAFQYGLNLLIEGLRVDLARITGDSSSAKYATASGADRPA